MKMAVAKMLKIHIWVIFGVNTVFSSEPLQNPNLEYRIDQPNSKLIQERYIHQVNPNSNTVWVNKTGALDIRLDCWAPYPIDLRFYGHLTNQQTTVKTFRKEYGTPENLTTWFIINATMETYEEVTGNYTCFSVEYPEKSSSFYILVSPTPSGVLLARGQKIKLQLKPEESKVTLPCAVSHPEVHVHLYKNGNRDISRNKFYDPKLGFVLEIDRRDPSVFGNYSCRTDLSVKDVVNITLIAPKPFRVEPQENYIHLPIDGKLNITCDSTEKFIIVTEPPLPVESNNVKQVDDSENAYFKYKGALVSIPLKKGTSGFVHCVWKASSIKFATWSFSVTKEGKPGELNTYKLSSCKSEEKILYECNNPVECQINTCRRKDSQCQSNADKICRNSKDTHCMSNGLIQCQSELNSVVEMFFTGFSAASSPNISTHYVDWRYALEEELLFLEEVDLSSSPKNKLGKYQFTCQGTNFVFSSGFKWTVHFDDETQISWPSQQGFIVNDTNISAKNTWKGRKSNLESLLTITFEEPLRKSINNISYIACHAPIWNSWKWISRNISIDERYIMNRGRTNENIPFNSKNIASSISNLLCLFLTYAILADYFWPT